MEEQYQRISKKVQADVEAGVYRKGRMLPTRSVLAKRFGVARATVDRAIRTLVDKGVLESRRGSGTGVASHKIIYRIALLGQSWDVPCAEDLSTMCRVERIPYSQITEKSQRSMLAGFDGVLWYLPEEEQLAWASELTSSIPQIILNRHLRAFNYVSTDHRGAIHEITKNRLKTVPNSRLYFLMEDGARESLVWSMRLEGFTDACRKARKYHEFLALPADFNDKIKVLETRLGKPDARPLVLVSGARCNTGAVVAWARSKGLTWKKNLFYSDFDNDFPVDVFGVQITSFVQDYPKIISTGVEKLLGIIKGKNQKVQVLVNPTLIDGQT